MTRCKLSWMLVVVCWLTATSAAAQVTLTEPWSPLREEIDMARPMAMGRTHIAIGEYNTGSIYNPAAIAQDMIYSIAVDSEFNPMGDSMAFHTSIVDTVTSVLCAQMGVTYQRYNGRQLWNENDMAWLAATPYYRRTNTEPEINYDDPTETTDFRQMFGPFKDATLDRIVPRLTLAGAINRYFMLGVTGKYVHAWRPMRHDVDAGNIDVGLFARTDFGLQFGVVGYNLIHTAYENWPLKLGSGIAFALKDEFYIGFDYILGFDVFHEREPDDNSYVYKHGEKHAFRAGIEYIIMRMVALRGGYEYDTYMSDHYASGGMAYKDPAFSVGIGYNQAIKHTDERLIGVTIDFQL